MMLLPTDDPRYASIDIHEPSSCLSLVTKAPTEEERLTAMAKPVFSGVLTETTSGGRWSKKLVKNYWACFSGPYISLMVHYLHDTLL
jgi:hypothetical protein